MEPGVADSLKNAASIAAHGMMSYYHGNESGQIPGKLPDTWWEGGALFMTCIQYWHFTGDPTYNDVSSQGMLWQAGAGADYMPANWSNYLVPKDSQDLGKKLDLTQCNREMMTKSSGPLLP
jgi:mannan endo-1,6-alpha-mannosidase